MTTASAKRAAQAEAEAEVLAANTRFYRAFSDGDLASMQALWAKHAPLSCLHPGMPLLSGAEVLDSWARILERPPVRPMHCDHARVQMFGEVALVMCYERSGESPAHLAATNVFLLEGDAWRLVHHHAGPLSRPMAAQQALGGLN